MTVRFLVGPAGAGKTHRCLERLRACEREGRPGIYLVPEQFTYSADRELLAAEDLPGLRHVRVLSFSRLAWWLHERAGVAPPPAIDPAVRPMYLRAVLERLPKERLGPLAALRTRHGLLEQIGRFIGEVRNHGTSDFLEGLLRLEGATQVNPVVRDKLIALGEVFQDYDTWLRDRGRRDPEEHLHGILPLIAGESGMFARTEVFVDGFLSWTRRESEVLVGLTLAGASLEVTFCMDAEPGVGGSGALDRRLPFQPVTRSVERLQSRLERAGIRIDEIVSLPGEHPTRFLSPDLVKLERGLYQLEGEIAPSGSNAILVQSARDPHHEVQTWARAIDQWLRLSNSPVRPEEIAIFVRNVERYREPIARIFPRFGIDYFLDERRSVLAHPRVRLLLGALDVLLSSWRRTSVISLLRNPYLGIAPSRVDLLENLSLELGRDFERWYDETDWEIYSLLDRSRFTGTSGEIVQDPVELLDPERRYEDGGSEEGEEDEGREREDREDSRSPRSVAREPLDVIRRRVLLPLRELERAWGEQGWTGDRAAAALESLLRSWVPVLPATGRRGEDTEWDSRIDDALATLLRELSDLWRDIPAQPEEVARSLREGLLALRLGVTPMRQGQVLVADVQRSRVVGIRAAIVGGVNEGVFPRTVSDDPILGDRDREALDSLGVSLGPSANERQEEEAYLFYIAMTRASEQVLVTWCGSETDGGEAVPSFLIAEIGRLFPELTFGAGPEEEEDRLPLHAIQNRAELGPALLSRLSRAVRGTAPGGAGVTAAAADAADPLWNLVRSESALGPVAREIENGALGLTIWSPDRLPEELLYLIFGDEMKSSVSRLQEFASCPFRSFAGSLLRLEPRPEAKVTPLETGTLAHRALELFFSGATDEELLRAEEPDRSGGPRSLDTSGIAGRLETIFGRLENEPAYRAFQVDEASRYRWASTRRSLQRYLALEIARLAETGYEVVRRELPFGLEGEPGLGLDLPEGRHLLLRGKIDRLDVRRDGDRRLGLVIDYKRSSRTGLPASLEKGTDLQLAAYLLYVRDCLGLEPAGGLYVPVLPSPPREEKADPGAINPLNVRAHGIFLKEEREKIDGETGMLVSRGSEQILPSTDRRDELLQVANRYLKSYAHNQRKGWVTARPLQTEPSRLPCDRCDFPTVCRHRRDQDPRRRSALEGMEVVE